MVPAWLDSGEDPLLGLQTGIFSYLHMVDKEGARALWCPFYKGTNSIYEGSTLMT